MEWGHETSSPEGARDSAIATVDGLSEPENAVGPAVATFRPTFTDLPVHLPIGVVLRCL